MQKVINVFLDDSVTSLLSFGWRLIGDGTDWMTLARTVSLGRWRGLGYKDGRSNAVSAAAAAGGPVITAPQLQPREGHEQQPLDNCAFD